MSSDLNTRGAPPVGKLPIGATVSAAYHAFFANIGALLWIAAPWLLIVGVLVYVTRSAELPYSIADMKAAIEAARTHKPPVSTPMPPSLVLLSLVTSGVVPLLAGVSTAVAWHRFLLMSEQPMLGGAIFSRAFWRYVVATLGIAVAAVLPVFLVLMLALGALFLVQGGVPTATPGNKLIFALIGLAVFVAYCVMLTVFSRLSLALPARAVGNREPLRAVWARTRGNGWRLFWGSFVCTLPILLLMGVGFAIVMAALSGEVNNPDAFLTDLILPNVLLNVFSVISGMIFVGFLSYAYFHFYGRPVA